MKKYLIFLFLFFSTSLYARQIEMLSPYTGESYKVSVLSEPELDEFYQYISTRSYIPFHIKWDGCYGRTYLMMTVANRKNIEMGKLVIDVLNKDKEVIEVMSPDNKWKLRWYYHVAPFVYLEKENGDLELRILDPSLFERPVTREEFVDKLTKINPNVEIDQVLLPKFVSDKNQLLSKVSLPKLDRMMMLQMSAITSRLKETGTYHELIPVYDNERNEWFKGGYEIDNK